MGKALVAEVPTVACRWNSCHNRAGFMAFRCGGGGRPWLRRGPAPAGLRAPRASKDGFVRARKGFERAEDGFDRPQKGFVRPKNGFVRPKIGFVRPKIGFVRGSFWVRFSAISLCFQRDTGFVLSFLTSFFRAISSPAAASNPHEYCLRTPFVVPPFAHFRTFPIYHSAVSLPVFSRQSSAFTIHNSSFSLPVAQAPSPFLPSLDREPSPTHAR